MDVVSIAASDQVLAAHEFAQTLPFVDASRWVVLGVSMGGLTSLATVWRHPPGLAGGINFSGGVGGRPNDFPGHPCGARQIASVLQNNVSQTVAPMLWLYWQNDQYWGPDIPKHWHQVWIAGGGNAEFHQLSPVGTDGHLGTGIDMDHWVPIAEVFFARIGFTKPGAIARPAASGFAQIEQFDKVPGRVEARDGYRKFLAAPKPRAYAVSGNGDWGFATGDWAMGHALGNCQHRGASCRLYAVDDDVVWVPSH
jgi:dienelactone hydrolase